MRSDALFFGTVPAVPRGTLAAECFASESSFADSCALSRKARERRGNLGGPAKSRPGFVPPRGGRAQEPPPVASRPRSNPATENAPSDTDRGVMRGGSPSSAMRHPTRPERDVRHRATLPGPPTPPPPPPPLAQESAAVTCQREREGVVGPGTAVRLELGSRLRYCRLHDN